MFKCRVTSLKVLYRLSLIYFIICNFHSTRTNTNLGWQDISSALNIAWMLPFWAFWALSALCGCFTRVNIAQKAIMTSRRWHSFYIMFLSNCIVFYKGSGIVYDFITFLGANNVQGDNNRFLAAVFIPQSANNAQKALITPKPYLCEQNHVIQFSTWSPNVQRFDGISRSNYKNFNRSCLFHHTQMLCIPNMIALLVETPGLFDIFPIR